MLSQTDTLTEIGNRRHFTQYYDALWSRAAAATEQVGVALVDVDNFKKYNDRYGHPAGDECLRRIAGAMKSAVRSSDVVCRYGGEEFVLLLKATDAAHAATIAERVRAAVAALNIPHELNPAGVVTVSIGVAATIASAQTSPASLVERADKALYRAKDEGRNRLAVAAAA
ncbi:diguanylate cyclase [Actinoplanes sp. NPDC051470]|uniref:diguanylate cyclase n=1 Tax=Actinoplanes sp. NPDC051470 TaxID=3157224 RepID=UPI00343B8F95